MLDNFRIDEEELRAIKDRIYKSQEKEIKAIYKKIADEINEEIYEGMSEEQLRALKKKIEDDIKIARKEIEAVIENNINKITSSTVSVHARLLKKIDKYYGTNLSEEYKNNIASVSYKITRDITKGKIYKDNRTLSKRVWGYNKKTIKDINHIINTGIKNNTNVYNIAKDLEKYVNPYERKDFNWKKVYPSCNLKVDYNAQRLARTSINHAYQDAYIESAKANPFIEYIEYNASHNARVCSLCATRDGKKFKIDDVPYDHPNGNCYLTSVIPDDLTDRIADMVNKMEL